MVRTENDETRGRLISDDQSKFYIHDWSPDEDDNGYDREEIDKDSEPDGDS